MKFERLSWKVGKYLESFLPGSKHSFIRKVLAQFALGLKRNQGQNFVHFYFNLFIHIKSKSPVFTAGFMYRVMFVVIQSEGLTANKTSADL